jgi:hypothetical protein
MVVRTVLMLVAGLFVFQLVLCILSSYHWSGAVALGLCVFLIVSSEDSCPYCGLAHIGPRRVRTVILST